MTLTIGFSPCPNDTFIFDALVNKKIDTKGIDFEAILEDVETLNTNALCGKLDVTKISYGVYPLLTDHYSLLNSGSALGTGVGPLLVAKTHLDLTDPNCKVAIPGKNTTAHLLFSLAYPHITNKVFLRYDEIENFVLQNDENVAGVIIHENRFTYQDRGLTKIMDLGEYWQKETGSAIPLGGIVAKNTLPPEVISMVDGLIKQSIQYSYDQYPVLSTYVKDHAQEMDESVMRKHIDLYVNEFSLDLGSTGKKAIETLLAVFNTLNTPQAEPINGQGF